MSVEDAGVVFLAGWGRSGSTLLDRLLGSLHEITSLGEMRDVCLRGGLENRRCSCGAAFRSCPFWAQVGRCAFGARGWDDPVVSEIDQARRRLDRPWMLPLLVLPRLGSRHFRTRLDWYTGQLAILFRAVAAVSGTPFLLDSSKIATHALLLRRAGLQVRVVHLVRDSRAVLWSWRRPVLRSDGASAGEQLRRYRTLPGVGRYLGYNLMAQLLCRVTGSSRRVRYEDLVASPAQVLGELLVHLRLPLAPSDGVALDQIAGGYLDLPSLHAADGNPMRLQPGRLTIRPDEEWRRALPRLHRLIITGLTAPLLLGYGYRLSTRLPVGTGT